MKRVSSNHDRGSELLRKHFAWEITRYPWRDVARQVYNAMRMTAPSAPKE